MISVLQQMFAPMANTATAGGNAESVAVYSDLIDINAPELTTDFSVLFDSNAPEILDTILPEMRVLSTAVLDMGAVRLIGGLDAGLRAYQPTEGTDPKVQPDIEDELESFALCAVDATAAVALPSPHLSAQVIPPLTEAAVAPALVAESQSIAAKLGPMPEIAAGQLSLGGALPRLGIDQTLGAKIAVVQTLAAKSDIPPPLPKDVVRPDPIQTTPAAPVVIPYVAAGARADLPRAPVITPPIDAKSAVENVVGPDPMVPVRPQPAPQTAPQPVAQAAPQTVPQTAPQPVPQAAPYAAPQPVLQAAPQTVPQTAPQPVPQAAPQAAPQPAAPNLAQRQVVASLILPNPIVASLAESVFHTQIGAADVPVAEPVLATVSLPRKPSAVLSLLSGEARLASGGVRAEIIDAPAKTALKPILAPDAIIPSPAKSQLVSTEANIVSIDIAPAELAEINAADLAADVQLWPVKPEAVPPQNLTQTPVATALSSQTAPIVAQQFAAQILPQANAAKKGPIELVLNPAELGHLRFEIHQKGAHLEVVLLAERPETLELLRRHGDQLASEFRNAGFSGASLSFGHWDRRPDGQPPARFVAHSQDDLSPVAPPQQAKAQAHQSDARNLNLRL